MPAQIGWGVKEKLLYKLKQIIRKKAKPSAQEIGWGTEEKLLYAIGVAASKANESGPVYPTTTTTTTVIPSGINLTGITNIVAVGDSITVGSNASPSSNSYIELFKSTNSIATIGNIAVSGRGVWQGINELHNGSQQGYTKAVTVLTAMAGLNDMRRGGNAAKTLAKIEACHKAYVIKHYFPNIISARDGSITRTGTISSFDNQPFGGLLNSGEYTSTAGASWEYTFSGTSIGVMFMNEDGIISTGWGDCEIYIDNILVDTYSCVGKYDAISDGAYNNQIGPSGWYKLNLSNTTHTIKIVALTTANVVIDYFATGATPSANRRVMFCEIPYLSTAGYAISPSSGSVTASNAASAVIEGVVTDLVANGYSAAYAPTNTYYNLATGLDTDEIHPNNTGHAQIANALQSQIY